MPEHATQTWERCRKRIRREIPQQSYRTWIEPIEAIAVKQHPDEVELHLGLPSNFHLTWLQQNFATKVEEVVQDVAGDVKVRYEVTGADTYQTDMFDPEMHKVPRGRARTKKPAEKTGGVQGNVNRNYTFDRFIEGDCNRLARAAGVAIAENPGATNFNPCFFYGSVGLGKTHLVQAIVQRAHALHPEAHIVYITSERFTGQFVRAVQENNVAAFTNFYRNIDMLVVDDVQFFGGKEKTQEEFFHIFNALHQQDKQVVLCSDTAPQGIDGIEKRLLSRFSWGLSADLQTPRLETREAIVRTKADERELKLSEELIDMIVRGITDSIRALEGALNRLQAVMMQIGRSPTAEEAKRVLGDLLPTKVRRVDVPAIQRIVAEAFNVTTDMLIGRKRQREIVDARQVAMFLCRSLTDHSYQSIGTRFGGRDHSTVLHACRTITDRIDMDAQFAARVNELEASIARIH